MIPKWTMGGVLPPIRPGKPGNDPDRSPYCVSIVKFIERFAISPERNKILYGLLDYRKSLYDDLGVCDGFQWLDGSFTENIETLESRHPKDVDVVSFLKLPTNTTQQDVYDRKPVLFDHNHVKTTYCIDSYYAVFNTNFSPYHIREITYWYSMWSHRRDGQWKGYLQIPFDAAEDINARALLDAIMAGGSI